jgi:hypothetical protein
MMKLIMQCTVFFGTSNPKTAKPLLFNSVMRVIYAQAGKIGGCTQIHPPYKIQYCIYYHNLSDTASSNPFPAILGGDCYFYVPETHITL